MTDEVLILVTLGKVAGVMLTSSVFGCSTISLPVEKKSKRRVKLFFIVLNAISNHNIRYDHVLCFMRAPKTLSCSDFLMDCGYRNSQKKRQK